MYEVSARLFVLCEVVALATAPAVPPPGAAVFAAAGAPFGGSSPVLANVGSSNGVPASACHAAVAETLADLPCDWHLPLAVHRSLAIVGCSARAVSRAAVLGIATAVGRENGEANVASAVFTLRGLATVPARRWGAVVERETAAQKGDAGAEARGLGCARLTDGGVAGAPVVAEASTVRRRRRRPPPSHGGSARKGGGTICWGSCTWRLALPSPPTSTPGRPPAPPSGHYPGRLCPLGGGGCPPRPPYRPSHGNRRGRAPHPHRVPLLRAY